MTHVNNNIDKFLYRFESKPANQQMSRKNRCHSRAWWASMTPIIKPMVALTLCASSVVGHAAILNDSSERRIQVRHGNDSKISNNTNSKITNSNRNRNVYIAPSAKVSRNSTVVLGGDSMQGLIEQKQRGYNFDAELSIEENKRVDGRKGGYSNVTYNPRYDTANNTYSNTADMDFNTWLNSNSYRAQQVANYQRYLASQIGAQNVPPIEELLTTARSWDKCGYEPYQLPPQELWSNIVPTLRLYSNLKSQGVLPPSSQIRSVYRSPGLNDCAGGANSSKHMTAGAMDIWVPEYDNNLWLLSNLQDGLCQFWQYQGQSHNFGLGLYSSGAIHLDTQGYRKWGFNHVSSSSSCRY